MTRLSADTTRLLGLNPPKPLVTAVLAAVCIWAFMHSTASSAGYMWCMAHVFSTGQFLAFLHPQSWAHPPGLFQLIDMMFWANFIQPSWWALVGNLYFVWLFGSTAEPRLGWQRYGILVLFSLFVPWILLGMEANRPPLYAGAGPMLCSLAGIYLNFIPEKRVEPRRTLYRRYESKLDDDARKHHFGLPPSAYLSLFVAFQLAVHVAALSSVHPIDTIALLPGLLSCAAGYFACLAFVMSAAGQAGASAMRLLALRHYKKLRTLDMTHEEAIIGAASLLSIPVSEAKRWINQGGGPLNGPLTSYKRLGG